MKIQHKIPIALKAKAEPISERYQAELDNARTRAERVWRQADRRRQRAEQHAAHQPTSANKLAHELVCAEAERLWAEFEELDRLMRQAPVSSVHSGAGQIRHRTGRDDNLQLGVHKRPRKKRPPRERRSR